MTDYSPPIKDMLFNLRELSGVEEILALDAYADFDLDLIEQVIEEAGKFSAEVLGPLNIPGDQVGTTIDDKVVTVAPGFAEAYQQYVENGWQGVVVSPEYGGMGMPDVAGTAAVEALQSACMAFSLGPMLTTGAIIALDKHGAPELKETYLPKLATGEWTGTMNLTEPQAGSDLAAITTKATPDGSHYRIRGAKIFITWGDHEAAENIAHLVLARIDGAPEGVRGISMFLVPKYRVNDDGSLGERNDVFAASIEHKLGIHGSPTCVMSFGEGEGAVGYLVGEENKGLACMFTMMNHARIEVGVQGLSISERAYQLARRYALDRVQGRAPGKEGRVTIVNHPDVRRMLLIMKAGTEAMRSVAMATAGVHNLSTHGESDEVRQAAASRLALLTPVVKGWMTEFAQEITSLGVQVHGGMGYVEETGAAQHMRDARILTIYEGTTGIQAGDLAGRKILADEGREAKLLIAEIRALGTDLGSSEFDTVRTSLSSAVDDLEAAVDWLLENAPTDPNAPGSASVNLLLLFGTVLGGYQMARSVVAISKGASDDDTAFATAKKQTADFYATHLLTRSAAYRAAATAGSDVIMSISEASL